MPRHLIVSCGTSQIDEKKLNLLKYQRPELSSVISVTEHTPDAFNPEALALANKIAEVWGVWKNEIGKRPTNPLGAEIATLEMMQREKTFTPKEDTIGILYSETVNGAFCAAVLRKLLLSESIFGVSDLKINLVLIREMKEKSSDADKAEENLCKQILAHLKEGQNNSLVITGGFKSVIPFYTTIALYYGIPMYYLFEDSPHLRCLKPPAEIVQANQASEGFFKSLWSRTSSTERGLKYILNHRMENIGKTYSSPNL